MPWRPLPALAFAICVHPFSSSDAADLPLQIGDNIYIIEQGGKDNEWFRGYLMAPPSLLAGLTAEKGQQLEHRVFSGIFPRNCVEVKEYLGGKNKVTATKISSSDGDGDSMERRRIQAQHARRVSRALSRKKSQNDVQPRERRPLIDPNEPMPRVPGAPKPLAPVPLLRVGDETGQSLEEPLVDEISSCLREWHNTCLHELILTRKYQQLQRAHGLIKEIDVSRKQLMHEIMTTNELAKLREDTVWQLVAGNKLFHDEVIVRSPSEKGRTLTADDSVIEMTKLQANMSILDRPPVPALDFNTVYHIMIDVRNLVSVLDEPATLQMYLCTKEGAEEPRPICETYSISLPLIENPQAPEEKSKTLFINLSGADIGVGAESTRVYAAFKMLKDQPIRPAVSNLAATPCRSHQSSLAGGSLTPAQKFGSLKSRRSVFRAHSRQASSIDRPDTAVSDRTEVDGRASSASSDPPPPREVNTAKRLVGVGVLDVSTVARQQLEQETSITLWTPASFTSETKIGEEDGWNEIIRELQRSNSGAFIRQGLIKRFDVYATAFASSDADTVVRSNPALLHHIHRTQKLGFSGVPTERRSDIYLTLVEPFIRMNAVLQHSKFGHVPVSQRCQTAMANFQLTLEVRNAGGERIEDCIFTSSNHMGHTAWRTIAVEIGETWNQTIKLSVPARHVPGSHIVMSIADTPNFPFALAWIPLWENNAFVRDGDHHAALYVYDEYSSSMVNGKGAYLALPPWHEKKQEPPNGSSATISVRTYLCSTEFSQDPNLLGLLNWREFDGRKLVELLEHFAFVPEIEIVKLLREVFNALFQILDEHSESLHEDLVFHNLVLIMTIARDRRFNIVNVVEEYVKPHSRGPIVGQSLLAAFRRLVSSPLQDQSARKLRATLKVGDRMLRLIVQTNQRSPDALPGSPKADIGTRYDDFDHDVQKLFVAMMALMRNPMPILLGTQTLVVQHFHTWLPELAPVMGAAEILEVATNLLDACSHAQGKMVLYRLLLIVNYSQLEIFKQPGIGKSLIADTSRWLDPYWGETGEITPKWRDQIRLCCSVVAAQMENLGHDCSRHIPKLVACYNSLQKVVCEPKRTFSLLFPTAIPFPSRTLTEDVMIDEAMLEVSALLATTWTSSQEIDLDANEVNIPGVLLQALSVIQSVLQGKAFPTSWLSLHVCHHRYTVTALERIQGVLIKLVPDAYSPDEQDAIEFDTDLWRKFFETLFMVVSSPALAIETFPEQKRRAVWKIAGDVREMGAALLKRSWDSIGWLTDEEGQKLHGFDRLGGFQVQFVPSLVAPVLEMCLSVHASLRNVAVDVLRTMIISSWELDQNLDAVQSAMIDCLDKLCRTQQATESMLQKTFINEMVTQFESLRGTHEDELHAAITGMFSRIEQLLSMLTSVHSGGAKSEATRIVDTLRLMQFLKDVQSDRAYIRYVHQLAELQSSAGNHTEAGLALEMHASRYEWDPMTNVDEIVEPWFPAQTAFERKEALFVQMSKYFERGQCWYRALAICRELAQQYESNTFNFPKLARSQRTMAGIYDKIASGDGVTSRYFRVVFKGLGFHSSLRNKGFIFEGLSTDRQATFETRMQQLYPEAQISRGTTDMDMEGQFINVYPVSINKDVDHPIYRRTKVLPAARQFALTSNPQKFTSSSRQQQAEIPITEQVVEKTIYTTFEPFPTLMRRSEVASVETVTLTPTQAAIDRTTRKTQELLSLEQRINGGDDDGSGINRLSEELILSVDPDSDSSVSRYRTLLPRLAQPENGSEEIDLEELEQRAEEQPLDPMQEALKVALLDHVLAIRRCLRLYTTTRYLATRNELLPRFEATYEHEINILFPNQHDIYAETISQRSSNADLRSSVATDRGASGDATTGAHQDATDGGDQPAEAGKPAARRLSLQFLRRGSSSAAKLANGNASDAERARTPSRSASRSRTRDQSLARRLSLFRNEQQQHENAVIRGGGVGVGGTERNSFKKRISFSRGGTSAPGGAS